jgi:hypothetical protein
MQATQKLFLGYVYNLKNTMYKTQMVSCLDLGLIPKTLSESILNAFGLKYWG